MTEHSRWSRAHEWYLAKKNQNVLPLLPHRNRWGGGRPFASTGSGLDPAAGVAKPLTALERRDAVGLDPRTLLAGEGTAQGLLARRDDPRLQAEVPGMRRCTWARLLEALGLEARNDLQLFEVREERCAAL